MSRYVFTKDQTQALIKSIQAHRAQYKHKSIRQWVKLKAFKQWFQQHNRNQQGVMLYYISICQSNSENEYKDWRCKRPLTQEDVDYYLK